MYNAWHNCAHAGKRKSQSPSATSAKKHKVEKKKSESTTPDRSRLSYLVANAKGFKLQRCNLCCWRFPLLFRWSGGRGHRIL